MIYVLYELNTLIFSGSELIVKATTSALNLLHEEQKVVCKAKKYEHLMQIEDILSSGKYHLIIYPSSLLNDENEKIIKELKRAFPSVMHLSVLNGNMRSGLRLVGSVIDYMVLETDQYTETDIKDSIFSAWSRIKKLEERELYIRSLFHADNFPLAIYSLRSKGLSIYYKDFDVFPDSENRFEYITEDFLNNLGLNILLTVGQGHSYHESSYLMPAGNSTEFSTLVFSFKLSDPHFDDIRLKQGYYQLCLFIRNEAIKEFPPISMLRTLVGYIKNSIPDSLTLADKDAIVGLKYSLLNKIKQLTDDYRNQLHHNMILE